MKKFLSMALSFLCVLTVITGSFAIPARAEEAYETDDDGNIVLSTEYEYWDDGSYTVTTITTSPITAYASGTTIDMKTKTSYNASGAKLWSISVLATFTYDGVSAKCINAIPSSSTYADHWSITSRSASISGNSATATGTAKQKILFITTHTQTMSTTLKCDKNGNVS